MIDYKIIFTTKILPWLETDGLKVVGIIVAIYVLNKIFQSIIEKIIRRVIISDRYSSKEAEEKRENTLIKIINSTLSFVLLVVAVIMILQTVGVPVGPIIAAAGVAGVALGFGGQYLIRDVIAGLFVIIENQFRVGDIICIGSTCGVVENLTLRMTTLRDLDGTVHHVSNSEINKVSNLSKKYSRVNMNIGISYDADLTNVIKVVNRVGNELAEDPVWKDAIIKAPQFLRIDKFGDSSIDIKILGDTKPGKQWDVAGELRLRIKEEFDKANIEIPFPQRVIHHIQG